MRFINRASVALMVAGMLAGSSSVDVEAYQVFVGYADNAHSNKPRDGAFPSPWEGDPRVVVFAGAGVGVQKLFDAGAIMIANDGPSDITFNDLEVDGVENGARFALWKDGYSGTRIPPGMSMIFTQTTVTPCEGVSCYNFDTSDQLPASPVGGAIPRVTVTMDGNTQSFLDMSRVLNTGGVDTGADTRTNESHQWTLIGSSCGARCVGSVLTQHNDAMRTGAYLVETTLTPPTVREKGMSLQYWRPVDGKLTAQPLYAKGVRIDSRDVNVVYAVTDTNVVYAYDAAEKGASGTTKQGLLWGPIQLHPTLPPPQERHPIELSATPVIDLARNTLFVLYGFYDGFADRTDVPSEFRLAALDIRTGERLRDVLVGANRPGPGGASRILEGPSVPTSVPLPQPDPARQEAGKLKFDRAQHVARAGLLLAPNPVEPGRKTVYVAFAVLNFEGKRNYHGWVMGYDSETFELRGVFCSTPDRTEIGEGGGIWQGGAGLAADESGNVYFTTGNGPGLAAPSRGNSVVKLTPAPGRQAPGALDFEVASFSAALDDPVHRFEWEHSEFHGANEGIVGNDIDLGAGGVTVIPGSFQLVAGGKTGVLYLIDRRTMTKQQSIEAFDNTYEQCREPASQDTRPNMCSRYGGSPIDHLRPDRAESGPHLHGAPTYWKVSPERGLVFHWSEKDSLKRFEHNRTESGRLAPEWGWPRDRVTPGPLKGDDVAEGKDSMGHWVMPGGLVSLSANGTSDGLLWVTLPWRGGGRLLAYDETLGKDLLLKNPAVPDTTTRYHFSHRNPPTVADGRVFVGAWGRGSGGFENSSGSGGMLLVYGLGPRPPEVNLPSVASVLPPQIRPDPQIRELLRQLAPQGAAAIAPPQGHRPLSLARGTGVLTYEARRARGGASVEWALVDVSGGGELRDESGVSPHSRLGGFGQILATGDGALRWTGPDGTRMSWSVEASVNAPAAGNGPWMLFRSVASGTHAAHGGGPLGAVTYVQQLATEGGAPPGTTARSGRRVDVPYTATYAFYVAASGGGRLSGRAEGVGRGSARTGISMVGVFRADEEVDLGAVPAQLTITKLLSDEQRDVAGLPLTLFGDPRNSQNTAYFRTAAGTEPIASVTIGARQGNEFTLRIEVSQATYEPSDQCPNASLTTAFAFEDSLHAPVGVSIPQPWLCFGKNEYLKSPP